MLDKIQNPEQFKHFVWRRHDDAQAWRGYRSEIVSTNGTDVRRISVQPFQIAFQQFTDIETSMRVINRIENGLGKGVAMLGYSMFASETSVAVLHTGQDLGPGWIAFPFSDQQGRFPTMPISSTEIPMLRLVGGAHLVTEGTPTIRAALEQRGSEFLKRKGAFNILAHLESWELVARLGDDDTRILRLVDQAKPRVLTRPDPMRVATDFFLDPIIFREFAHDERLQLFHVIKLNREFMCLPEDWLTFSIRIELPRSA
ncbi:MAG: hypothetical protein R3E66_20700 [bacterium]